MRVLVACEFSGIVRDAFRAEGHDATSCDLLPTERPGPHIVGDVLEVIDDGWDLLIGHPPCTYLCLSGVRWLSEREGRWEKMREGARFFRALLDAPVAHIAIENPIPHRYAVEAIGMRYTDSVQPWQYGDPVSKRVCLWLKGLPPLMPETAPVSPDPLIHHMAPGPERAKERSRFFPGLARAMAEQWGAPMATHQRRG